jgi:hypothetical protein
MTIGGFGKQQTALGCTTKPKDPAEGTLPSARYLVCAGNYELAKSTN